MDDGITVLVALVHLHGNKTCQQMEMIDLNCKCDGFTFVIKHALNHGMTEDLSLYHREFDRRILELFETVFKDGCVDTFGRQVFVITIDMGSVLVTAKATRVSAEPCAIGSTDTVVEIMPRIGVDPGHGRNVF